MTRTSAGWNIRPDGVVSRCPHRHTRRRVGPAEGTCPSTLTLGARASASDSGVTAQVRPRARRTPGPKGRARPRPPDAPATASAEGARRPAMRVNSAAYGARECRSSRGTPRVRASTPRSRSQAVRRLAASCSASRARAPRPDLARRALDHAQGLRERAGCDAAHGRLIRLLTAPLPKATKKRAA